MWRGLVIIMLILLAGCSGGVPHFYLEKFKLDCELHPATREAPHGLVICEDLSGGGPYGEIQGTKINSPRRPKL